METADHREAAGPSLKPFVPGLHFGFFNAVNWMISLGTPMVLLATALGASPGEVALGYSAVFLLLPVQVVASAWLPVFGYKAQMIFGWSARNVFLFVPFALALMAPAEPAPWMAPLMVGSVVLFCAARSLGSGGYLPWMLDLLPKSVRGRYFASDQLWSGLAGVVTLLFCAGAFQLLPPWPAYALVYGVAIVGAWMAVYNLAKLPDVPKPPPISLAEIAAQAPRLSLSPGPFRDFLAYSILFQTVAMAYSPFAAYYLATVAGWDTAATLGLASLQYLGAMGAAAFLRGRIDRVPAAAVFRVNLLLMTLLCLYWLAALAVSRDLLALLPAAYLLNGAAGAFYQSANLRYLPQVCPEKDRHVAMSVHAALVGLLGGLATTALGFLLRGGGAAGAPATLNVFAFGLFFVGALAVQGVLALLLRRFVEVLPGSEPLLSFGDLFRPVRSLVGAVNLFAHKPKPPGAP